LGSTYRFNTYVHGFVLLSVDGKNTLLFLP
jgi:hypothetical protein